MWKSLRITKTFSYFAAEKLETTVITQKKSDMKPLTNKEEEIMNHYWEHGGMQIRELQALYNDPKPHVNTLSTLVHILEDKGFLGHEAITQRCYKYFPKLSRDDYRRGTLSNVVNKFFGRSYMNVVSTLVKDEKISLDDLRELIKQVESNPEH